MRPRVFLALSIIFIMIAPTIVSMARPFNDMELDAIIDSNDQVINGYAQLILSKLPEDESVYAVIAVGYPDEKYIYVTGRKPALIRTITLPS